VAGYCGRQWRNKGEGKNKKERRMTIKDGLEIVANIASIVTAIVAVSAWTYYQLKLRRKRQALENHLSEAQTVPLKSGLKKQRTLKSISAKLGLTEADILQAAFDSHNVKRIETLDPHGYVEEILLEHK
jgi:hypothetical protein